MGRKLDRIDTELKSSINGQIRWLFKKSPWVFSLLPAYSTVVTQTILSNIFVYIYIYNIITVDDQELEK